MKEPNDLKFINTNCLKFFHSNQGVIASYKKKKFILGLLSISKEGVDFKSEEYLSFAETTLRYHCQVRNVPLHPIEKLRPVSQKNTNDYSPFYKYVSNDVFENYIKKGIFQLGTIEQYRTIENIKQRVLSKREVIC